MSFHTQKPNAGHGRVQGAGEEHNDDDIICSKCGQGPFTWLHTGVRWRLVGERGKLHVCPGIKPDDFEDLV